MKYFGNYLSEGASLYIVDVEEKSRGVFTELHFKEIMCQFGPYKRIWHVGDYIKNNSKTYDTLNLAVRALIQEIYET